MKKDRGFWPVAMAVLMMVLVSHLEAAPSNQKRALRLAREQAFEQDSHGQLKSTAPGVKWGKPARWKWSVVEERDGAFVVSVSVKGHRSRWNRFGRRLHGELFSINPEFSGYLPPPRAIMNEPVPGKWTATRQYVVDLNDKEIHPVAEWAAKPLKDSAI